MFTDVVNNAIKEILFEVINNPLTYFSEKSLQVKLASKLLRAPELSTPVRTQIEKKYQKQINRLNVNVSYLNEALSIPPLQMEYGTNDKGPYRVDIAILNPQEIKKIDSWKFQAQGKYLNPQIGIEIGTEKTGIKRMSGTHLENDAFKLRHAKNAYIISVIRNTNICNKQSKSYLNKVIQLDLFREGLKNIARSKNAIKWIGLILHIAYKEVEFFDIENNWCMFDSCSPELEKAINTKLGD